MVDLFEKDKKVEGLPLILGYLGLITMFIGFICLVPLLTLIFYPEEVSQAKYFILPGVISILIGYFFYFFIRGKKIGKLQKNQDSIIILFTWAIAIFICAVPFVLTGGYNFHQAIFETTSGFSTTGLSVVDVTNCPRIFLIHRSTMLFVGGIGLVLIMTSAMSDSHGMRLYNAEGHSDKLVPNLMTSARFIVLIYSGYILAGIILYVAFGMSLFDAINHSIASVSTGGFSTKSQSIGYYQSLPIEIITIVLMILGTTNFFVHLLLLRGQFKKYLLHCETKLLIFILAFVTPLLGSLFFIKFNLPWSESIRKSLFQIVSAFSTTGFQTVEDFNHFSSSMLFIMTLLMLIGGGAGSTAGGIKQYRICLLLKSLIWSIKDQILNKNFIRANTINKYGINEKIQKNAENYVIIFTFTYLCIFALGTFIFTLFGYTVEQSMFEFSSAIGTVGLSVGITGYNAHPIIHWTGTIGMFLGRLEIYVVFLGIWKMYRDSKEKVVEYLERK